MDLEMVAKWIELIVAPVVMVTTCAILLTGILSRYAAVNDRLRALARERLDLLRRAVQATSIDTIDQERLSEIDHQMPELLGRHELIRDSILAVYGAIVLFIVTMLVIAVTVTTSSSSLALAVLVVFLAGTACLLVGTVLTAWETRLSHHALRYEVERVTGLSASMLTHPDHSKF